MSVNVPSAAKLYKLIKNLQIRAFFIIQNRKRNKLAPCRKTRFRRTSYSVMLFVRPSVCEAASFYPFTAPIVRPETKYFWKKG